MVDGGYTGNDFADQVKLILNAKTTVAKRNELHMFTVLPQRWIVERSWSWLDKCRLKEALNRIPVLDYRTTVHTDQGFQYQHRHWQNTLKEHHVFQSMSRKATCLDNAAMESFFHIMKVEVMDEHFETKTALIEAMNEWIDFYNHRRIKTKLDGKSPVKYRELTVQKAA